MGAILSTYRHSSCLFQNWQAAFRVNRSPLQEILSLKVEAKGGSLSRIILINLNVVLGID